MRLLSHASLFAAIIVATSLLGFAREVMIAREFGISMQMDCFIAAFIIVWFLSTILSPQTLQTMFMPAYQDERRNPGRGASELFHNMALLITGITMVITAICYVLTPQIITLLMPGFKEEEIALSTDLMHVMLPMIVIYALCNLAQALCHSHERFVIPISAHFVQNVTLIVLLVILPVKSVHTLAEYYVYSALISSLILIPSYLKLLPGKHLNLSNRTYLHVFASGSPLLLLALLDQFAQILPRSFASLLSDGDIAALNYAFRLVVLPVAVAALTIASFMFPRIIEAVRDKTDDIRTHIVQGGALVLYALAPVALFIGIKNHEIVQVLFSSSAFKADAVARTASALSWYAIGMPTLGYMMLLNRVYAAYKDYKGYMKRILVSFALLGLTSWLLLKPLQSDGLALAFSLYSFAACVLLLHGLRSKDLKHLVPLHIFTTLVLALLPSAAMLYYWQSANLFILVFQGGLCMVIGIVVLWLRRDPVLTLINMPTGAR